MPDGIIPDEGLPDLLAYMLGSVVWPPLGWQLRLWVNDYTPVPATTLADLQEATFGGYGRRTVDQSLWTEPEVTDGCAGSTLGSDPTTWTVTAPPLETIYGYALVDPLENLIRFVQRFDADDLEPLQVGDVVKLLPTVTLTSAACGVFSRARVMRARIKGRR